MANGNYSFVRMAMLIILALLVPAVCQSDVRIVIDHECIEKINTDHAYLVGPDLQHMIVYGLKVQYKSGCERLDVTK